MWTGKLRDPRLEEGWGPGGRLRTATYWPKRAAREVQRVLEPHLAPSNPYLGFPERHGKGKLDYSEAAKMFPEESKRHAIGKECEKRMDMGISITEPLRCTP